MSLLRTRFDYSPIIDRPVIRWPGSARLAVYIAPAFEHYEYLPDYDGLLNPWPRTPYPDVQQYAYRDYGNRVGLWRLLEVFDAYRTRCTVILNLAVLEHYPEIGEVVAQRDWAIMSHGFYNTSYLYTLSEEQEREFLRDSIETAKQHTGRRLRGMLGPAITATDRTPDLMAEAGFLYHAVWMLDDQPVPIRVRSGRLIAVPYTIELNDAAILRQYHHEGDYFVRICKAQFDQLYREGAESGRVMCVVLHPYLIGQPHRIRYLAEILDYIASHDGVWQATADEIVEYYLTHYYDAAVAHARRVAAEVGS
jgi:peptidoglycan/xylan/chitin deacetylase (PgdA/CDA1 family)